MTHSAFTVGSSSVVVVSSEAALWGGAASVALVPSLLGTASSGVAITNKVGMAKLSTEALGQLGNDLKARERIFIQASAYILHESSRTSYVLAQASALDDVTVIGLTMPDLVVADSAFIAQGEATLTVQNSGSREATAVAFGSLQARLGGGVETVGLTASQATILPPNTATTVRIPVVAQRSTTVSGEGYYLQIRVTLSTDAGAVRFVGPFVEHFVVGTTQQVALLAGWSFTTLANTELPPGAESTALISTTATPQRIRLSLFTGSGSDYDVHLYDSLGRHTGMNYTTGTLETQIPGAIHSGPRLAQEWIELSSTEIESYEVRVVSLVPKGSFTLTQLASQYIPPSLEVAGPLAWNITGSPGGDDALTGSFSARVSEYGGFEAVQDATATVTQLTGAGGSVIAGDSFRCNMPSRIPAGQSVAAQCVYRGTATTHSGFYRGALVIRGTGASGAEVSVRSDVDFTLSAQAANVYFPLIRR